MSELLTRHQVLLDDTVRMMGYSKAVRAVVKPGMVVADIGAGLGVLSRMAIEAGASKVYAIEFDADTIAHADHNDKIIWRQGLSGDIHLPEKVDVIVSETLGSFALDENILPTLIDARRRFLKRGGVIIPQSLKFFVAPTASGSRKKVQSILLAQLLAEPASQDVDFTTAANPVFTLDVPFEATRDAVLSGFTGWFDIRLFDGISFSTSPDAPKTHWKQGFLPIRRSQKVKRGQRICFRLVMEPDRLPTGVTTHIGYDYHVD